MNSVRICGDCKATDINTLVPKIEALELDIKIEIGCQNFCGIGQTKSFAIVNNMPIICDNEDELVLKIKETLDSR